MKFKKSLAVLLSTVMACAILCAPQTQLTAEAANVNQNQQKVYTYCGVKDVSNVWIQTPQMSTKLAAGLTWEQLDKEMSVRLNVTESECGPAAYQAFGYVANALGAIYHRTFDMDLESFKKDKKGAEFTHDFAQINSPIRITMALPNGYDQSRDYAFISVRQDGNFEVLGDLDQTPSTITVDSSYFDTFALISGPQGAFNKFRFANPAAVQNIVISDYIKNIPSTIPGESKCSYISDIGVQTPATTVQQLTGAGYNTITIKECNPGVTTQSLIEQVAKAAGAKKITYYDLELKNGYGTRITKTAQPIRVAISLPYNYPAYADFALAIVNEDGTVSIKKDLLPNDSTIIVDTNAFRAVAMLWAPIGTFK